MNRQWKFFSSPFRRVYRHHQWPRLASLRARKKRRAKRIGKALHRAAQGKALLGPMSEKNWSSPATETLFPPVPQMNPTLPPAIDSLELLKVARRARRDELARDSRLSQEDLNRIQKNTSD